LTPSTHNFEKSCLNALKCLNAKNAQIASPCYDIFSLVCCFFYYFVDNKTYPDKKKIRDEIVKSKKINKFDFFEKEYEFVPPHIDFLIKAYSQEGRKISVYHMLEDLESLLSCGVCHASQFN